MLSAREQARMIGAGEISAVELMGEHYDRIEAVEPQLGAIVNALPREQALELAREADRATAAARAAGGGAAGAAARGAAAGESLGLLHGLPIAVKDVMDVAGFPTTAGTVIHADRVATRDSLLAERLKAAGALIIGKTNTPEHGLGTLTFNKLFPPTRNPYDLTRHAGGSSGGAAAAVAAGLLPLADGSDSGGSLRYPAAFCNVVGLRPSPGRIPSSRPDDGWSPHGVLGPIARDVGDAGLLLAAMAGRDDRTPIALDDDPLAFAAIEPSDLRGVRIAWSRTVDGLPIDPEVTAALEQSRALLVAAGAIVEEVEPDLSGADEAWETIEMLGFLAFCGADVDAHREQMRDDIVRNVEQGRALTAQQIVEAQALRTAVYRRTTRLLERYDLLATPTAPVVAPPIEVECALAQGSVAQGRHLRSHPGTGRAQGRLRRRHPAGRGRADRRRLPHRPAQ
ncbi:MAG TPA: amidase family protein, partial [Conexibacter sp.]|nr:amidase family protein [Conexibacter sp.]